MADIATLDLHTPSVQYLCGKDTRLGMVIRMVGPITYEPHADNPFPFLIHEIIEQMLSVKAGDKLFGRLETLCKGQVTPESIDALSVGFTIAEYGTGNAMVSSLIIALVTFVVCMTGLIFGKKFGENLGDKASIFGGIILIAIGLEIFIRALL